MKPPKLGAPLTITLQTMRQDICSTTYITKRSIALKAISLSHSAHPSSCPSRKLNRTCISSKTPMSLLKLFISQQNVVYVCSSHERRLTLTWRGLSPFPPFDFFKPSAGLRPASSRVQQPPQGTRQHVVVSMRFFRPKWISWAQSSRSLMYSIFFSGWTVYSWELELFFGIHCFFYSHGRISVTDMNFDSFRLFKRFEKGQQIVVRVRWLTYLSYREVQPSQKVEIISLVCWPGM